MLKDIAEKYYIQGYNCAESLIRAGNEYYNLNLDENALKMTGAFGGGFHVGDVRLCCQIKAKHYSQEVHCLNTVKATAEILEQVLTEYEKSH